MQYQISWKWSITCNDCIILSFSLPCLIINPFPVQTMFNVEMASSFCLTKFISQGNSEILILWTRLIIRSHSLSPSKPHGEMRKEILVLLEERKGPLKFRSPSLERWTPAFPLCFWRVRKFIFMGRSLLCYLASGPGNEPGPIFLEVQTELQRQRSLPSHPQWLQPGRNWGPQEWVNSPRLLIYFLPISSSV